MSKSEKTDDWNFLWSEYTKSLEHWKSIFEQVQAANSDMQSKFNTVWQKALTESSSDTMKVFGENWQKSLSESGVKSFKEFSDSWQKALNDSNTAAFRKFAENYQTTMSASAMEQMAAYGEVMKKFAETWDSMWPKP